MKNVIFINNPARIETDETIKKWLKSEWNFYNKKIKLEPSVVIEIMNTLDMYKTNCPHSYIRQQGDFGFITDDSHVYYVINTGTIVDINELKKRFMEFLDTSIKNMHIPTDSKEMIENYEMNLAKYINKIEKEYKSKKALLVKVIHIDKSNNAIELIDSILPGPNEQIKYYITSPWKVIFESVDGYQVILYFHNRIYSEGDERFLSLPKEVDANYVKSLVWSRELEEINVDYDKYSSIKIKRHIKSRLGWGPIEYYASDVATVISYYRREASESEVSDKKIMSNIDCLIDGKIGFNEFLSRIFSR